MMFRKTTWMYAGVIFWATLAGNAIAADAPATRTHEITIDDYFSLATIGEVKVSPDGKYVAYTQTRWQPPDELRNTDIWVVEIETKKNWRVTFDDADDTGIQWGPASDKIYFASGRTRAGEEKPPLDGKNQIWMTTLQGGSSRPVTRVQDGISAFELSRDGRYAYYTVASDKDEAPFKELREKFATVEYAAGKTKTSKLFRLDLETWRAEELYAADRYIRYFAVSPDQARVAMITDPDNRLVTHEGQSRVDILDVASREVTTLTDEKWRDEAPSPHGWLENLAWSDDSAQLAFTVAFDGFPSEIMIGAQGEGGKYFVQQLPRSGDYYVEGGLDWKQQKNASVALQFRAADRGRTRIFEQNIDTGETRTFTSADVDITAFDEVDQPAGATNVIAASMTGEPGNLFIVRPSIMSSAPPYERLTNINPQVRNWILPRIEVAQWQAPDGTTVEGILELPHNWKEGNAPLPLVVEIHGGPTSSTKVAMRYWIYGRTLLASKGYALMSPNYRGSTGYGDTFMTDLVGRECDIEVQDILSGVDAMIERGIADPERLGVMGWSNGGFLTNCLVSQTNRFKAASSGAGVIDQLMQWGVEDTPGHVVNYMQGLPWEQPAAYLKASPVYKLAEIQTPTLIHVGADDPRVPAIHAKTLFRALHDYNNIPTQLCIYPGQGHGLNTYTFRKAKMEWDLAWFEKYLRGGGKGGEGEKKD